MIDAHSIRTLRENDFAHLDNAASSSPQKACAVFLGCLLLVTSTFGLTLAERGRSGAEKVGLPADANECVRTAADELVTYCQRLTGEKPCGKVAFAFDRTIRFDGFRLKVADGVLTISASTDRGILYGVYELLETYGGCGWFSSWTETVPSIERLEVPDGLDRLDEPDIEFREPFCYDINNRHAFAAKMRRNAALWTHPPAKFGGNAFAAGAGLRGHTFETILPVAKYFDEHPEYYADVSGKRQRTLPQLCCSNPEVRRLYAEKMIALMRKDPDKQFYAIGHNDNRNYCHCKTCQEIIDREGCTGAPEFELANYVAERIEKEFPNALIKLSAYEVSRRPPKHLKLRKNVMLDLCPIECDYSVPIDKSPYAENVAFMEDIVRWSERCEHLMIFDYITNFENYLNIFPNLYSLQDNLRLFKRYGARYVCEEGCHDGLHGEFAELKGYLLAKLMWKLDQPLQPLIEKFCRGYYGAAAAPFVLEYIEKMQALNGKRDHRKYPLRINRPFCSPVVTDAFLEDALRLWQGAERAARASGDEVRLANVRYGALSPAMVVLQRQAKGVVVQKEPFPSPRLRSLAKFALDRFRECPYIHTKEGTVDKVFLKRLERICDPTFTIRGGDCAVVEAEDVFRIWGGFNSGVRDDPKASGGKAILYSNKFSGDWVTYFPMSYFGREAGARYRFSVKVRCARKSGAPDGNLMYTIGYPDREIPEHETPASEIGEEYGWVTLGEWTPSSDDAQLVVAPGRFDRGKHAANPAWDEFWFDQVKIEKISAAKPSVVWQRTIADDGGRYVGWPTVTKLRSGEIVAVYSGDRDGHICPWGKVRMVRSADRRETWSRPSTVVNGPLDDRDAAILELANGDLLLFYFTSIAFATDPSFVKGDAYKSHPEYAQVYAKLPKDVVRSELGAFSMRSSDGGRTWEKKVRMPTSAPHGGIQLKDGRVIVVGIQSSAVRGKLPEDEQSSKHRIVVAESADDGRSWRELADVPYGPADPKWTAEPHLIEGQDGVLRCYIRFPGNYWYTESRDGGRSWMPLVASPVHGKDNPAHLLRLKDGRVLMTYGRRLYRQDEFATGRKIGVYAQVSDDDAKVGSWDEKRELAILHTDNNDMAYASSVELDDGSVLTVYYYHPKGNPMAVLGATKWNLPD